MTGRRYLIGLWLCFVPVVEADVSNLPVLNDGQMLVAMSGKLHTAEQPDTWTFALTAELPVGSRMLPSGTHLPLLPNAVLGDLLADGKKAGHSEYRLWARATRYRNHNYLFVTRFGTLAADVPNEMPPDPNTLGSEAVPMPPEIRARIQSHQVLKMPTAPARTDRILLDRLGILTMQAGTPRLVLKARGRSTAGPTYRLLPCQVLEQLERQQRDSPDTLVFRVVGIRTTFRGDDYLLLQRAVRSYGHGNFN